MSHDLQKALMPGKFKYIEYGLDNYGCPIILGSCCEMSCLGTLQDKLKGMVVRRGHFKIHVYMKA